MSNSIDTTGPRLKIARANRHIRDLENIFEVFISSNPYKVVFDKNPQNMNWAISADFEEKIPVETSAIIGDAIHNLRSSLDHLAALAIRIGGQEPGFRNSFPIYPNQATFDTGYAEKLTGAPREFVEFVVGLNPHGENPASNIYPVGKLNNLDKHDTMIPSIGVFSVKNIQIRDSNRNTFTIGEIVTTGNGVVNIAQFGGVERVEVNSDTEVAMKVVFNETSVLNGEPIVDSLRSLSQICSEIISAAGNIEFV